VEGHDRGVKRPHLDRGDRRSLGLTRVRGNEAEC